MTPFCFLHSTAPHWTVMLEEVMSDMLTEVGGPDGAGYNYNTCSKKTTILAMSTMIEALT